MSTSRGWTLTGGRVLWDDSDTPEESTFTMQNGAIAAAGAPAAAQTLDVDGLLVLPGIIDVHGDAFERCLMPRGGVDVEPTIALAENDAHLLGSGITTSFLSATDSWEPGLRSRAMLRSIVAAMQTRQGGPDVQLHVRHETCNTEAFDELLAWVDDRTVAFLSFNDHAGTDPQAAATPSRLGRAGVGRDEYIAMHAAAIDRRADGQAQELTLAAHARAMNCPTASHDASTDEHLARDLALGVAVAEFPMSIDLATKYRASGMSVLLGAPNLVRGASHLGNLSVRDAVVADTVDMLCSDYHYPSLLHSPAVLVDLQLATLAEAWSMVSARPAAAAGLTDRGRLAPGLRADVVVIEPSSDRNPARLRHVFVNGELAWTSR